MRKLFLATTAYLILGLASGLFYREFTKINGFTAADDFTQLSVVHTHLLTLGVIVLLIVLLLEKAFELSRSRAFGWFFWIYNLGLVVTAIGMTVNGMLTVLGIETSKALAGISGSGHILLTAGLVLLFAALGKRIRATTATGTPAAASVAD
jgi:cbb3-type cytochrome oxidase subunit 1